MAQGTILPNIGKEIKDEKGGIVATCDTEIQKFNKDGNFSNAVMKRDEVLGCAIVSGKVSLAMLPYFIQYISNYLLGIISLVALLFTVIGGVLYSAGGLTEKKDQGKTYIKNALFGMGTAFLAWTVVNVIISAITG